MSVSKSTLVFIAFSIIGAFADSQLENSINQIDANGNQSSPQARFGFPITYGNDLQGYNTGASYAPVKIELGGIFLGTLIGLGAVLIAPKLAHIFSPHGSSSGGYSSGGYSSGYSRAVDDGVMSGIKSVISRIDEALQANKIDSTACLERAACTYMQYMNKTNASDLLGSSSSLIDFVIDGSKLKAALEKGVNQEDCSDAYPQCAFSKTSLMLGLRSMMTGNSL